LRNAVALGPGSALQAVRDDGNVWGVERTFYVYMLASQRNGTLYVGVTSHLSRRVYEHREGTMPGFTAKYGVKMLVWYELFATAREAIAFEKRLKRWRRSWKLELIERFNPRWDDLYLTLNG
jgi:putative endonuclease